MNPELPRNPQEELEARLTALLLGELSAAEAATVRQAIEQDGELAKLFARLHHTIGLVRETVAPPVEPVNAPAAPLKLSEDRRQKLLAQFKTVEPKEFTPKKQSSNFRLLELAAVVAIIALLAAMLLPTLSKSKAKAQHVSVLNNLRQLDAAKQQWALENHKSAEDVPTFEDVKAYLGRGEMPNVAGETYVLGKVGEPPSAEVDVAEAKQRFGRMPPGDERSERVRLSARGELAYVDKLTVENHQFTTALTRPAESEIRLNMNTQPAAAPLPTPPRPAQIVLPAIEGFQLAGASEGKELEFRDNPGWRIGHILRGFGDSAVNPTTNLPVVTSEFGLAQDGAQDSEKFFRYKHDPNRSPLPFLSGSAGAEAPAQTTKDKSGDNLALSEELNNDASLADRRRYGATPSKPTLPRVAVSGGMGGGGGPGAVNEGEDKSVLNLDRAGKLLVPPPPPERGAIAPSTPFVAEPLPQANGDATFAEISPTDSNALRFDATRGNVPNGPSATTGKDGLTESRAIQPPQASTLGEVITISGRTTEMPVAGVPVLEDMPVVGQLSTNSVADGFAATGSSATQGIRIVPEPNVTSFDVVGSTDRPSSNSNVSPRENENLAKIDRQIEQSASEIESLRRQLAISEMDARGGQTSQVLVEAESVRHLIEMQHTEETKLRRLQSQIMAHDGKGAAGTVELSKEATATQERVDALQRGVDKLRDADLAKMSESGRYFEKKRELQELTESRRLLARRMNVADIDQSLPKSSQVVIVEHAKPKSAPSQSVWGAFRSAVSGDVERVARIKVERDKSDIEELSGKGGVNLYDPYFIQTEFEVIQSEAVLGKVVSQLGLDKTWAKNQSAGEKLKASEAVSLLRKHLDLRAVPNTALVEIRAKADQPEEAARIANAVAEAYKQWRLEQGQRLVAGGLEALGQRVVEQDEQIRRAKAELEALGDATGVAADLAVRKPATNAPIPQPEVQTSENNFSTFSLNVSDVSFKLAAASLEQGQMPDVATVRSEEFINAFDYRDPEPAPGASIAFAWERARYPFAHNRDLLRFSLKTAAAGRQAGRPLNVVLLLDNSGSMERADRVKIIREALRVLASQLQPQDKLSVITFARTARLLADGVSGDKAGEVTAQVNGLTPEGGTNLEDALNLAYQTAGRHYLANGINRVVLLTDGAANLGDVEPDSLKQKVEAQRQQGIALDCFGIGWEGFNDDLLEVLSRNGDGRYGFINSAAEAATEFAGQLAGALKVAASDVKVQVEFNPKRVRSYRQIGYAKHQLTKEQFRDNTVDAAEIAAQEAGNALYTVEVNPAGEGPLGAVRVRYKVPGTTDYRERSWDVPFTGNVVSLEASSPALRLAATAGAFSEWLVASPFAGEVSPHALLGYLRGVPEIYGADIRPKKLEWMLHQAKSMEGK